MKFKTTGTKEEPHITLFDQKGNAVKNKFFKVNYKITSPEIDFFDSLGKVSGEDILSTWLLDQNRKMTIRKMTYIQDSDTWRKNYWKLFYELHSIKSKDWEYESEYRLISTTFSDESKKKGTMMTYDFNDLEGIIFGINTPLEHMHKIMNIVKEKCIKNQRKDFSFYQAYHCPRSSKIKTDLIKK